MIEEDSVKEIGDKDKKKMIDFHQNLNHSTQTK